MTTRTTTRNFADQYRAGDGHPSHNSRAAARAGYGRGSRAQVRTTAALDGWN
jgi:hypothetical protein